MDTLSRVRAIVAEVAGIKIASADDVPADLGIDSVGMVEIAFSIEDIFEVELRNDELRGIRTVKDLATLIDGKCRKWRM
ncbi:MAG: acyl carrier protein [Gammaproteobacteria bacterium]